MKISRIIIDSITISLGRLRKKRKLKARKDRLTKVNLGAGLELAPGWINIDGSLNYLVANLPKIFHLIAYEFSGSKNFYKKEEYCNTLENNNFIHHDISFGVPFQNENIDYIYSSHFLEHLYLKEAKHLLNDCYRVLKKGGQIRISVPDLEHAINLYKKGQGETMLSSYFFMDDESFFGQHKYMYDFKILSSILEEIGFINITKSSYKHGNFPDIEILDSREGESLFIEACK